MSYQNPPSKSYEIIIIEDDRALNRLIVRKLDKEGFKTKSAYNAKDGLEKVTANTHQIILIDYNLPDMTAKEFISELSAGGFKVPFIIMTGHGDTKTAVEMMKLGAKDYIIKQDNFGELLIHRLKKVCLEIQKKEALKKSRQELEQSQQHLEEAMKSGNLAWWILQLPSGKVRFHPRKARMLGYEPENFNTYHDFTDLVHPEDYSETMQAMQTHIAGQVPKYEAEYRIKMKNGNYKWFRDIGSINSRKSNSSETTITGIIIDIDDRKKTQKKLYKNKKELNTIFNNANDAIYLHKLDKNYLPGQFINVNEKACQMLGYSRKELLKMSPVDIDVSEKREMPKTIKKLLSNKNLTFQSKHKAKDGRLIPVEINSHVFKFDNSTRIISIARDISERLEAQKKIRKSREELSSIYKNAPLILMLLDEETRVKKINQAGLDFRNSDPSKLLDMTCGKALNCINHRDVPRGCGFGPSCSQCGIRRAVLKTLETGSPQEMVETTLPISKEDKVEYMTFLVSTSLLKIGEQPRILVSILDITARKRAEEELKSRNQLYDTISRLSTNFINTPITKIDNGIDKALQKMGEFVKADRSYIFQLADDQKIMDNTYEWCDPGIEPQIDNLKKLPTNTFPWWMKNLKKSKIIKVSQVEDMPPEAETEKAILKEQDIKSVIVVPLIYNKKLIGFMGFDAVRKERSWTNKTIELLRLVGDMIVNAISRKKAEKELKRSEEKFRSYVENANNIVYSLSPEGIFKYVSPNWEEILGHKPSDVIDQSFKKFVNPQDIESNYKFLKKVIKSGEKQGGIEYRVKHRNGNWRWHLTNASPIKNDEGEVVAFLGVAHDVTERKITEEKLRLQKEQFELAVKGSQDGIWDWNLKTNELYLSPRWKDQLGYEDHELSNTFDTFYDNLHPDDRQRVMDYVDSHLKGEQSTYDIEFRMAHKNGHYKWIRARGEALFNEKGQPYRMAGSHTDITMRKKSEQILKERTHQLSERVKELNCLFELSKIIESKDISLDQIYHQVIEIIPPAWQYPSITCAKLKIKDRQFSTENYEETSWQLKSDIFFKNKKYGSLTVGYLTQKPEADEGPFIKEERLLLDAISERLGRVIERIKVENRLKKYRQDLEELVKIRSKKLKRSMQRLNEIEEKMRKNAAQKLHDQVGQNLSALKLNMNYLQSLLPAGHDQNIGKRINDSINLLEETIDHITNIMTELRPPLLQDYGLSRALKTLSQQFTERTNIKVNLNTEQASARLPENIETTLFRVIQELFNNIAKHSQANIVDIKIKKYKDQLIIRVADDGIGFDTEKVDYKAQNTFGIMTMNERLNLINGSLKIQSSPGQGTTAEIKVEDIK